MDNINKTLFDAIDLIVQKRLEKDQRNYTITGIIASSLNDSYLVKYQGTTLKCYPLSPDIKYKEGQSVYILILNGNMNNDKFILSETKGG